MSNLEFYTCEDCGHVSHEVPQNADGFDYCEKCESENVQFNFPEPEPVDLRSIFKQLNPAA